MNNEIFRQKSVDRIQSPDNLKEYIKVVNPSIWVVFISALILLIGAFVWGTFGRIEDKVAITAVVTDGTVMCEYHEEFEKDMPSTIGTVNGKVASVKPSGVTIQTEQKLSDGVYSGFVVVGEISPISFVFN